MAITAIRTSNGKTFFGQDAGELGPANLYYNSAVRANITGTIDTTAASTALSGTGTAFTTELTVGGYILTAGNNLLQIKSITSNTAAVLLKAATATETNVTAKPFYTVWLGQTQNVVLSDAQQFSPITFIQQGQSPTNQIETGYDAKLTVSIGEGSVERLTQIFDHIRASRDTVTANVEGYYRKLSIGSAHSDYWARLTLVKIKGGVDSTDPLEQVTFLRCAPMSNMNVTYDSTSQRVVEATFQLYKSDYYVNGSPLLWYGGAMTGTTVTDIDGVTVANIAQSYP